MWFVVVDSCGSHDEFDQCRIEHKSSVVSIHLLNCIKLVCVQLLKKKRNSSSVTSLSWQSIMKIQIEKKSENS